MSNTFATGRGVSFHEMNRLADALAGKYMFPESAGGAVTTSAGLTVAVAAITGNSVTINGTVVATAYAGGTVAASAADATNPRRDLIYYDTSGAVGITAGTPAATPFVPTLTSTQIAVAELYVAANAVTINSGDIYDRRQQVVGAKRSSGGGTFLIPTGPAVHTTVTSAAGANTYGSWVEMLAATSAAIYIIGVVVNPSNGSGPQYPSYVQVDIGTGAGGAESSVGEFKTPERVLDYGAGSVMLPVDFPIPVATSTRIACRTADSMTVTGTHTISLIAINQSDVVTF